MSLSYAKLMVAKLKKIQMVCQFQKIKITSTEWMILSLTPCVSKFKTTKLWGNICILRHTFRVAKITNKKGHVVPVVEESSFSKYCNIKE